MSMAAILLKIAEILLAGILGLLLLLVLLLLLPVKYSLSARVKEKDVDARMTVRWLFGFVHGRAGYDNAASFTGNAAVFGKTVWQYPEKALPEETPESVPGETLSMPAELSDPVSVPEVKIPVPEEDSETAVSNVPEKPAPEKLPFMKRLKERVASFNRKIRGNLKSFYDSVLRYKAEREAKSEASRRKKEAFLSLYREEDTKRVLSLFVRSIRRAGSHLLPKKGGGEVLFGTGDPAGTAKILEILAVFYPVYGRVITVTPDFEEKTIRADLSVRGRIVLFYIALIAARLYLSKRVKHVVKRCKEILDESEKS